MSHFIDRALQDGSQEPADTTQRKQAVYIPSGQRCHDSHFQPRAARASLGRNQTPPFVSNYASFAKSVHKDEFLFSKNSPIQKSSKSKNPKQSFPSMLPPLKINPAERNTIHNPTGLMCAC